jgi:hypothetical protein
VRESEFRTEYASRAYIVANLFNTKFQHFQFTGKSPRIVMVMPTEEQSTAGGKLARNAITLKPLAGSKGQPLSVGWFDVGQDTAQLLTFEALYDAHEARHGKKGFDLKPDEYDKFLDALRAFLEAEKFNVDVKTGTARARKGSPLPVILAATVVVALAAVGAVLFLGKKEAPPPQAPPPTKPPATAEEKAAEDATSEGLAMALRDCPKKDANPKLSRRLKKTFDKYLAAGKGPRNTTAKIFRVTERLDDKADGKKLDIAVASACGEQIGDDDQKICRLMKVELVRSKPRGKKWSAWQVDQLVSDKRMLCEKLK